MANTLTQLCNLDISLYSTNAALFHPLVYVETKEILTKIYFTVCTQWDKKIVQKKNFFFFLFLKKERKKEGFHIDSLDANTQKVQVLGLTWAHFLAPLLTYVSWSVRFWLGEWDLLPFRGNIGGSLNGISTSAKQTSCCKSYTVQSIFSVPTVGEWFLWLAIFREKITVLWRVRSQILVRTFDWPVWQTWQILV